MVHVHYLLYAMKIGVKFLQVKHDLKKLLLYNHVILLGYIKGFLHSKLGEGSFLALAPIKRQAPLEYVISFHRYIHIKNLKFYILNISRILIYQHSKIHQHSLKLFHT